MINEFDIADLAMKQCTQCLPKPVIQNTPKPEIRFGTTEQRMKVLKDYARTTSVDCEAARNALESLDDYACMDIGVDARGPRRVLEKFINKVASHIIDIK